jgi:hypothetical protein
MSYFYYNRNYDKNCYTLLCFSVTWNKDTVVLLPSRSTTQFAAAAVKLAVATGTFSSDDCDYTIS